MGTIHEASGWQAGSRREKDPDPAPRPDAFSIAHTDREPISNTEFKWSRIFSVGCLKNTINNEFCLQSNPWTPPPPPWGEIARSSEWEGDQLYHCLHTEVRTANRHVWRAQRFLCIYFWIKTTSYFFLLCIVNDGKWLGNWQSPVLYVFVCYFGGSTLHKTWHNIKGGYMCSYN